LISLVFADAPNESGIAAPPAQHIVAVTQYIVDFSSEPMLAESARNGAGKFTSAQQYDFIANSTFRTGIFDLSEPPPHEHLMQNHDQPAIPLPGNACRAPD
jgi:hypothetical protein